MNSASAPPLSDAGTTHADRARRFFDRPPPPDYLDEWSRRLLQTAQESDHALLTVLIVRLHAEFLALPIRLLVEVTLPCPVHVVPHRTNRTLLGLVNIRGQLRLCVSLHGLLEIEPPAPAGPTHGHRDAIDEEKHRRLVIVQDRSDAWVFPVEEVMGIHRVAHDSLRDVPATFGKGAGASRAVFDWKDRSVGLLDDTRLLATLRRSCS